MFEKTYSLLCALVSTTLLLVSTTDALGQCTLVADANFTQTFINPTGLATVHALHVIDEASSDLTSCPSDFTVTARFPGSNAVLFSGSDQINITCQYVGSTLTIEVAHANSGMSITRDILISDVSMPVLSTAVPSTITADISGANFSRIQPYLQFAAYCPNQLSITVDSTSTVGGCGTGTLERTFTVRYRGGNAQTFVQTIHFVNTGAPYDGTDIVFPADTTLFDYCSGPALLTPDQLPAGYDQPTYPFSITGAMLALGNYRDQVFTIDGEACYKIIRTWTVVDMCQFDPNNPGAGEFTQAQIIEVMDTTAPVLTLPGNVFAGVDNTCQYAAVNIAAATATDCGDAVITNDSPFANAGGANASGNYPIGRHVVTFTAKDGCNNKSRERLVIEVTDMSPPKITCKNGLITDMGICLDDAGVPHISATFTALQLIDRPSRDNCSAAEDIQYTIRVQNGLTMVAPTDTAIVLDCTNVGLTIVEIWATDAAGNSDYCVTTVEVQDNFNLCTNPRPFVAGGITSLTGMPVAPSSLTVNANPLPMDSVGRYFAGDLEFGSRYELALDKTDDPRRGLSTWDLSLAARQMLGHPTFDHPLQWIASDLDLSGSLSGNDLILMQNLILGRTQNLPTGTPIWRFVPKTNITQDDAQRPLLTVAAGPAVFDSLTQSYDAFDFWAVKTGDINGSAHEQLQQLNDRNAELKTVDAYWEYENGVLKLKTDAAIAALECTFAFQQNALEMLDLGGISTTSAHHNGQSLTGIWYAQSAEGVLPESTVIAFEGSAAELQKLQNSTIGEVVGTAYTATGEPRTLVVSGDLPQQNIILGQNKPNPFQHETFIEWQLPLGEKGTFVLQNTNGQVVLRQEWIGTGQLETYQLDLSNIPATGLFAYTLFTSSGTNSQKLVRLP